MPRRTDKHKKKGAKSNKHTSSRNASSKHQSGKHKSSNQLNKNINRSKKKVNPFAIEKFVAANYVSIFRTLNSIQDNTQENATFLRLYKMSLGYIAQLNNCDKPKELSNTHRAQFCAVALVFIEHAIFHMQKISKKQYNSKNKLVSPRQKKAIDKMWEMHKFAKTEGLKDKNFNMYVEKIKNKLPVPSGNRVKIDVTNPRDVVQLNEEISTLSADFAVEYKQKLLKSLLNKVDKKLAKIKHDIRMDRVTQIIRSIKESVEKFCKNFDLNDSFKQYFAIYNFSNDEASYCRSFINTMAFDHFNFNNPNNFPIDRLFDCLDVSLTNVVQIFCNSAYIDHLKSNPAFIELEKELNAIISNIETLTLNVESGKKYLRVENARNDLSTWSEEMIRQVEMEEREEMYRQFKMAGSKNRQENRKKKMNDLLDDECKEREVISKKQKEKRQSKYNRTKQTLTDETKGKIEKISKKDARLLLNAFEGGDQTEVKKKKNAKKEKREIFQTASVISDTLIQNSNMQMSKQGSHFGYQFTMLSEDKTKRTKLGKLTTLKEHAKQKEKQRIKKGNEKLKDQVSDLGKNALSTFSNKDRKTIISTLKQIT